jgi:hypothetical protein
MMGTVGRVAVVSPTVGRLLEVGRLLVVGRPEAIGRVAVGRSIVGSVATEVAMTGVSGSSEPSSERP